MFKDETIKFQIDLVTEALEETKDNVTKSALILGLTRPYLQNFIKKHNVPRTTTFVITASKTKDD